ncbi:hypothetical protein FB45DRAFT_1109185 [Roridomyces roridus]|uniref:F-box domain-containing protein n=1 Tax=Roridomyces roridus TaxID=1738132 RepID=A0AAD7BA19_9AGAR|nr:hypothetical protein FB45DRAFT_1109185 [Roridomyces roridus]
MFPFFQGHPFFQAFLGAHGLTALSLRVEALTADASIHWESLRRLTLVTNHGNGETPGSHLVLPILRQCSHLETLNVDFDFSMDLQQSLDPQPPCDLPHLRRLSVSGCAWALLRSINSAPELRILPYVLDRVTTVETPSPLVRLVSCSNQLQCLRLDMTSVSSDTLMVVLGAIPTLRELTLRGEPRIKAQPGAPRHRDSLVVPMLTPNPNPTPTVICPRLKHLKLVHLHALSDEDLLAFVLARTDPNISDATQMACLSELTMQSNRWCQVDIIPSLELQMVGWLKVNLVYHPKPNFETYSVAHANDSSYVWDPSAREWDMPDVNTGWYGHP